MFRFCLLNFQFSKMSAHNFSSYIKSEGETCQCPSMYLCIFSRIIQLLGGSFLAALDYDECSSLMNAFRSHTSQVSSCHGDHLVQIWEPAASDVFDTRCDFNAVPCEVLHVWNSTIAVSSLKVGNVAGVSGWSKLVPGLWTLNNTREYACQTLTWALDVVTKNK